jgi:hypothetical protein
VEHPGIGIVKSQRISSSGSFVRSVLTANVGQTIEYQIVVADTGDTSLTITLRDPRCDAGTLRPATAQTIAAGASLTYTCSHVLRASDGQSFTNVAIATGITPSGVPVGSVSSSVTVTTGKSIEVGPPHTVTKPHKPKHHAPPARPVHMGASFTG